MKRVGVRSTAPSTRNIIVLVAAIFSVGLLVAMLVIRSGAVDNHTTPATTPTLHHAAMDGGRAEHRDNNNNNGNDRPAPQMLIVVGHHPQRRKLLIFDTSIGRMSNQLLTMTAAIALAAALNRTAVLPPLFLGGGRGGGGSRVVPLTELYNFENWQSHDDDPMLYCEPASSAPQQQRVVSSLHGDKTPHGPLCFVLENERPWQRYYYDNDDVMMMRSDTNRNSDHNLHNSNHDDPIRSRRSSIFNDELGCMKMKGVQSHPLRRKTRPVFECGDASSSSSTVSVASKKRLPDVLRAGRLLKDKTFLFVPLAMYVSDALEPLVIRAWNAFAPHNSIFEVFKQCRDRVTRPETDEFTVGVHLRALEGSCKDRVQQVVREAPLLSGNPAPPGAASLLQGHCKIDADYVLSLLEAEFEQERHQQANHHNNNNNNEADAENADVHPFQKCKQDSQRNGGGGGGLSKCHMSIFVADDGQMPAQRDLFLSTLRRRLPNAQVSSLATCHNLTIEDSARSSWIASSDGAAKGTLALLSDFWQLDQSNVFIGNQLSTVSVNICRHRLAQGKRCDNFVSRFSGSVGKTKYL